MNNSFFSTTVGRFVISLAFAVGALVVAQLGAFVTNNPQVFTGLFGGVILLVINALLFAAKNFLDPQVRNI